MFVNIVFLLFFFFVSESRQSYRHSNSETGYGSLSAADRNDTFATESAEEEDDETEHLVPSSAEEDEGREGHSKWTESSEPEKLALLFDSCTAQFSNKCPEKDTDRYQGTNISRELRV